MRWVLAVVLALVLPACAAIPTEGPVQEVDDDRGPRQSSALYTPALPTPGASPQQVVRGFLDAMLAYPVSTGVAEEFLTAQAADAWESTRSTEVYSDSRVTAPAPAGSGAVEVTLRTRVVADLDAQGHWSPGRGQRERSLRLERVDDEWRIAEPPPGLLVTQKFADDYVRPFEIFFFDEAAERLVPDLVHLTVGDQLPTALVTSLTRGPADRSGPLRTFVPPTSELTPSVPVDEAGVADVTFGEELAAAPRGDQGRVAAQLAWTLGQVPGITGVRLVGGASVLSPNGRPVQPVDSWTRYVPRPPDVDPHGLVDGRVIQLAGDQVRPVDEPWTELAEGAAEVVVGSSRVAVVAGGRDTVRVADLSDDDVTMLDAAGVVTARWTPDDLLLLVDRPDATRVRVLEGSRPRDLPVGSLAGLAPTSFGLSPEGGRYAVTAETGGRTRVLVGPVVRDGDDRVVRLGDPVVVPVDLTDPHSVSWAGGTRLAVLADTDAGDQVHEVLIDGSEVTGGASGAMPLLPDVDARVLVLGPVDERQWAVDARRRLWFLPPAGAWRLLRTEPVTSLTAAG